MSASALPVCDRAFAAQMPMVPAVAVAVSGGVDSMALCLLLQRWAAVRGIRLLGLTVDHQLRPESAAEARCVAQWLAEIGIESRILVWEGVKPSHNIQEHARAARYALLQECCLREKMGALAVAHHREDQAETVLLRLGRGSGPDGLAGMAPERRLGRLRLLRPVLTFSKEQLRATCVAAGQSWLEDPSNRQVTRFARAQIRALLPALAEAGITVDGLLLAAARAAALRQYLETEDAAFLARAVILAPEGYAWVEQAALRALPAELGLRVTARLLRQIGGGHYPPRRAQVQDLWGWLSAAEPPSAGRTLAGCQIVPRRGGRWLLLREAAAIRHQQTWLAHLAGEVMWDHRFYLRFTTPGPDTRIADTLTIAALGRDAAIELRNFAAPAVVARINALPPQVLPTLPALWDAVGVWGVPHLHWCRFPSPEGDAMAASVTVEPIPLTERGG